MGEFLGTFLFLFFAFAGTQAAKLAFDPLKREQGVAEDAIPTVGLLLYVALAFGFSLAVNVWIFYRVSGGIFNPAVTLGVVLLGAMPPLKGAMLVAAQLIGGIFAAGLVELLLPGNLSVNTTLSGGINTAQGLFLEAFLTFELTLTIYMLAVEKVLSTYLVCPRDTSANTDYVAPSHIHGTTWNWSRSLHCSSHWYLFHWCIPEPSSLLRPRCYHQGFPNVSLDLL